MTALRAGTDLMAAFPGCEEGANILIFSTTPDNTFNHQTTVWFMRCGNVTATVSLDEPTASADADVSANIVLGGANASFNRVSTLPLQHDEG